MLIPTPYAIDIGDRTVKIAQLIPRHRWDPQHRWPMLRVLAERDLTDGLVVSGALTDPTALAALLQGMIARATPWFLRSAYAIITLPEVRTFLTTITVPPGGDDVTAVRRTVATTMPVDVERAVITMAVVPGVDGYRTIAAAPTDVVDAYAALLQRAGLTCIACTTEADALARAVAALAPTPVPRIILDFGATRTGAVIAVGPTVITSVTIPVSGMQLTTALAAKLRIDPAAAERAKRGADLGRTRADDPAATALGQALTPLVDGVRHLQAFAATHLPEPVHPTRCTLTGGGAALRGLDEFLRERIQLPVDRFALPDAVTTGLPPHAADNSERLATVYGLGLIALDPIAALSEPTV